MRRHGGRKRVEVRFALQHERQRERHILSVECALAGQHFIDHAAEGPNVGPLIDVCSARLLWRHVRRGSQDEPRLCHCRRSDRGHGRHARRDTRGLHRLREAKVEHLHRSIRPDLDVRGLQITVDDALLVRRGKRVGDLPRDWQHLVKPHRALRDVLGQRRAFDQLHDQRAYVLSGFSRTRTG